MEADRKIKLFLDRQWDSKHFARPCRLKINWATPTPVASSSQEQRCKEEEFVCTEAVLQWGNHRAHRVFGLLLCPVFWGCSETDLQKVGRQSFLNDFWRLLQGKPKATCKVCVSHVKKSTSPASPL